MEKITYSKAGVNIDREEQAIKGIKKLLEKTYRFRKEKKGEVLQGIGSFANLIDLGDYALGMCTDGVGSKVLVAQELDRYDTVGIDLVAMNVNDLICLGAEPIAMVDYLATEKINPDIIKEIMYGMYEGAKRSEIAIIGGELATLPDLIKGVEGKGFDLAGTAIGLVDKNKIITGEDITPGDVVLGFKSSGIHSNGLTLARKVLPKSMWMKLLTPTHIYVKPVLEILSKHEIHGMVNITGGGFRNLLRVTEYGFVLDGMPDKPILFKNIQDASKVSDAEMYKTFNMGVGFCLITSEQEGEAIMEEHANAGLRKIGYVVDEPGVEIKSGDSLIEL
ncbi:MAG: phosphoribosylformylglycinamidine cyclo-ligase [Candidatus Altiarchaeales archaeon ex4484_96]|nr:MAG: phosphoribosylformylglycinamidine cyclo-ligase [Candidatus Altiarchaeales archaeon ex4484_96]